MISRDGSGMILDEKMYEAIMNYEEQLDVDETGGGKQSVN